MQNKYKCRGIMKWAPFASLVGFNDLVAEELKKRHQVAKPELSDEQKDIINSRLLELKQKGGKCILRYYDNKVIKVLPCEFVDVKDGFLFIKGNMRISLYDIIDIQNIF